MWRMEAPKMARRYRATGREYRPSSRRVQFHDWENCDQLNERLERLQ